MKKNKKQVKQEQEKENIKNSKSKKNRITISIRLGTFNYKFFNEITIIQKAIGMDLNKTAIFLIILFLKKFLNLKKDNNENENENLKEIPNLELEKLTNFFYDYELNKEQLKANFSRPKCVDLKLIDFKKKINLNFYYLKNDDRFILEIISKLHKSIVENEKIESEQVSKFIPKLLYFFIEEGMKIFYESKIKDIQNLNFY